MSSITKFAGIHLSGPNAQKSAACIITGRALVKPLKITAVYERIGSIGKVFSDERMLDILQLEGPFNEVFVDCPLGEPPCVTCALPVCPGVVNCEDVSVAYMQAMGEKIRRMGARKKRPINPQSQRLWDIYHQAGLEVEEGKEAKPFIPTYNGNLAPLVVRAKTLQRRVNSLEKKIFLRETSMVVTLVEILQVLGLAREWAEQFRSFENGGDIRKRIVAALCKDGWLDSEMDVEIKEKLYRSVEVFQALITSLVAALKGVGLVTTKPNDYLHSAEWVYHPSFSLAVEKADVLGGEGLLRELNQRSQGVTSRLMS